MDPITIVKVIISVASAEEERRKADLLREISSQLANITGLFENVRQVVTDIIKSNEISIAAAHIAQASAELEGGELSRAHGCAEEAAFRLMQRDVQVAGCVNFLLAAGSDITILTRWAQADPGKRALLVSAARRYMDHAEAMAPLIRQLASRRVVIRNVPILSHIRHGTRITGHSIHYDIDGNTVSKRTYNNDNEKYYNGKMETDVSRIASPLVYPLRTAAETWRSIVENRAPIYSSIYEGCIIGASNPPTPGALINGGRRIQFEVAATISNFSNIWLDVSNSVFGNIPYGASIMRGARCVGSPGLPGCFITAEGSLAPVDSPKPITDNNSYIEQIPGVQFSDIQKRLILRFGGLA